MSRRSHLVVVCPNVTDGRLGLPRARESFLRLERWDVALDERHDARVAATHAAERVERVKAYSLCINVASV